MSEARKQDLEVRHRLGRREYKKRLEAVKVVCDDIRDTRVELARIWLAEHYPLEQTSVNPAESELENIRMGFELVHKQYHNSVPTIQIQRELLAYFDTIGGFNKFTE